MADEKGIRGLRPDQMSDKAAAEWWKDELYRRCNLAKDEILAKQAPTLEQREQAIREAKKPPCPNCGKPGYHWAPPSLGEPGFYVCGHPYADTDVTFEHPPCEMLASKPFPGVGGPNFGEPWQPGDPIDLVQKRASPYKIGTGRLYFEDQLGEMRDVGRYAFHDRLTIREPEMQRIKPEWSWEVRPMFADAWRENFFKKVYDEILRIDYAKLEGRILGNLMASGAYADKPDVIAAKLLHAARKKCDTALVTLAVAEAIDIPVRFRWEEQFAYYMQSDTRKVYIDLESPGGSVSAPYSIAADLERRFRVMNENAIKYGDNKTPFYRDFDKRKR